MKSRANAGERTQLRTLIDRVAKDRNVPRTALVGPGRSTPIVHARFAVVWLARTTLGASLPEIGRELGGRDHSTIHHAERRGEALRASDPAFRDLTDRLRASIEGRL